MDENSDVVAPGADDFEGILVEEEELASREIERLVSVVNALRKLIDALLDSSGYNPARLATGGAGLSDYQRKMINGLLEAKALLVSLPDS